MPDFKLMRQNMVRGQILPEQNVALPIMEALLTVPREKFVPRQFSRIAYMDSALPFGKGKALLRPTSFVRFLRAADLRPSDNILYLGMGSAYGPSLLGQMGLSVVVLVDDDSVAEETAWILQEFMISSVGLVVGSLLEGWEKGAPYDKIILEGSVDFLPKPIVAQLKEGGSLLCFNQRPGYGSEAMKYTKKGGQITSEALFDAWAPRLKHFQKQKIFVF